MAISEVLLIYFSQNTRYWHWNTGDPTYENVVSSALYMSFVFAPAADSSYNVIIKVPMTLLALTLDRGIVETPTRYFPSLDTSNSTGENGIGRAFLQAAFMGCNNGRSSCWLTQAPGPGVTGNGLANPSLQDLEEDDTVPDFGNFQVASNAFARSWENHWEPLPDDISNAGNAAGADSLSGDAKAGVGVGAAVAALLIVGLGVFIFLRRRRTRNSREMDKSFVVPSNCGNSVAEKMGTSIDVILVAPGELETRRSRRMSGGSLPELAADPLMGSFELSDRR